MKTSKIHKGGIPVKALVLKEYNHFTYEDVPEPSCGEKEVLVRVKAVSICGSDVHGMDGSTGRRKPPIIMGHEAAGVIEKVGSAVKNYAVGDRVTFDSTVYCGECERCRRGEVNLCPSRRVLGVSCDEYRINGAFAEYVAIPEHILYRIPEHVSYAQAAMVEPLSVAYHAATHFPAPEGGTAVVVGVGTIGLLVVQVLRSMGVKTIVAVDLIDEKLATAKEYGADVTINAADPEAIQKIIALTGEGADAAYDATGVSDTVNFCLKCVRTGGKVSLIGNLQPEIKFPLQWVVTREISIFGSCASAGEYPQCLDLIAEGKVKVEMMMSKRAPLSEGDEWFHRLYNKEPGLFKVVLEP